MKRGNKGQSANEAALLVIFLTFLMIITIAAVSDDIIRASDNNYRALLHDIADVIESEASIAFASENGYTHSFTLPQTLNGQPYAISIMNSTQVGDQANMTILSVASTRPNVHLNVTRLLPRDVLGTLVIGPNIVRKEQGIVTLMALPLPPPVVSSVSPSSGSTLGGTSVAISGSDFLNTPTAPTVTFGGVSGSVTSSTSNTINVVTPAHAAGAVNVVVTNPDGQFYTLVNGFTYVPPPSITSITPNSGSTVGGTPITITGDYFQSGLSVTIGTSVATDVVVSPDGKNGKTITATTSSSLTAGAKDVTVTNPDGQFSILPSAFTYVFPPSVTSITPNSGSTVGGTPITITGDYFQSGLSVTIGTSVATDVVVSPDGKSHQ
ncbi:IPT/TIG domain-containing protein [Candidatus Woesearchaeota archaeon]|nr:IPT/TIG domain-containing protein [Candidatus Woesearchaeota archaeon]